jgi:ABC-type microcin C transport system permease subunit YejB
MGATPLDGLRQFFGSAARRPAGSYNTPASRNGDRRGARPAGDYRGAQGLDPEFIAELERSSASTSRRTSASS